MPRVFQTALPLPGVEEFMTVTVPKSESVEIIPGETREVKRRFAFPCGAAKPVAPLVVLKNQERFDFNGITGKSISLGIDGILDGLPHIAEAAEVRPTARMSVNCDLVDFFEEEEAV